MVQRDWYFSAEQPAPAPHLARPEGCAALRIVLVTVPRVSRSCENFPDGFDLHLLQVRYSRRDADHSNGAPSSDGRESLEAMRKIHRAQTGIALSLCTGELNAIRKQNSCSAVLSTEGRVVGPCWAN